MSTGLVISIVVSLLSLLLCSGFAFLFFCLILGIILLRRRGKKKVTAREAVKEGVETVSMVFRRNSEGDLEAVAAKEQDDDDGGADDAGSDDATEDGKQDF